MITTSMMKHAKSSSFFPDLLEFHVLFWAYFSTIKGEKNRERVFKERVLFLALVYLTICGGWGGGRFAREQGCNE